MKKICKSIKLKNVKYAIRGKLMDRARELEEKGEKIIKLNIGDPASFNFQPSEEVIEDMKNNLLISQGYSSSNGLKEAREAIKKYYQKKNVNNLNIEDIYIGNGGSELILMSMQALLNKGDEILLPSPDYPLWTASVNLNCGIPVHYHCCEENNWYPDIEDIKRKISKRTKGIVIINPNNPTGSLYPKEILMQIVDLALENNLIIFSDEIYDRLVYDGLNHVSIASLSKEVPIITFSGLSKSHMLTGYRIGWMCITGNKTYIKDYIEGLNLLATMRLCSNVPGQSIIVKAINNDEHLKKLLKKGGRLYEQREYIYNRLKKIPGITVVKPQASFYIFPKLDIKKFNISDDEKFALDLLISNNLFIVNGTGFNYDNVDHFRLTFLADNNVLKESMDRLEKFLKDYHQ